MPPASSGIGQTSCLIAIPFKHAKIRDGLMGQSVTWAQPGPRLAQLPLSWVAREAGLVNLELARGMEAASTDSEAAFCSIHASC